MGSHPRQTINIFTNVKKKLSNDIRLPNKIKLPNGIRLLIDAIDGIDNDTSNRVDLDTTLFKLM